MLYHVEMTVRIPPNADGAMIEKLKAEEKAMALGLQRKGIWLHLWRIAGAYENISIFDVGDHDQLHRILSGLPLFPYMDMKVTPLALHPSALDAGESQ